MTYCIFMLPVKNQDCKVEEEQAKMANTRIKTNHVGKVSELHILLKKVLEYKVQ